LKSSSMDFGYDNTKPPIYRHDIKNKTEKKKWQLAPPQSQERGS
jgi:hypothetical protein